MEMEDGGEAGRRFQIKFKMKMKMKMKKIVNF